MKTYTIEQRKQLKYLYDTYFQEGISPYSILPFACEYMSPIEYNVWNEIRTYGLQMYPQYPVLNYFLDFGDPINKIGIEVDGREWHKDKQKDIIRQNEIESYGWTIYRFKGYSTYNDIYREYSEYECVEYGYEDIYETKNNDFGIKNYRNIIDLLRKFYLDIKIKKQTEKSVNIKYIIEELRKGNIKYPIQEDFEIFYA